MSTYWFPDNTVFCNFAAVAELDLLRTILDNRGRWVEAVAQEVQKSSCAYPALAQLRQAGWLGEPIVIDDPDEAYKIDSIRRAVFGGSSSQPTKHLGEAQTCYILKHWPNLLGSHWITDDRDAYEHGKFQGITTKRTADLISEAVQCAYLTQQNGFRILEKMADNDRGIWIPPSASDL